MIQSGTEQANDTGGRVAFNKFVGASWIFTGLCLFPPVFNLFFVFVQLVGSESWRLMAASVGCITIGGLSFILGKRVPLALAMCMFTMILIVWLELGFRCVIRILPGRAHDNDLYMEGNWTYPTYTAYEGSAFLQFIGKTDRTLSGSAALAGISPFNNYGFVGADMYRYKPANVIRVACLGESTTADGYPAFLEKYLNAAKGDIPYRFEVYNFGHAYWTTAHAVTNFVLNIRDFQPDIIVIHHGWNEEKVRNYPDSVFRGDYGHAFKSYNPPEVYDRYLIRISALYRYFKFKYDKSPAWTNLAATIQKNTPHTAFDYSNLRELEPYRRNIRTILELARVEDIGTVLTTLPHTRDTSAAMFYAFRSIDQCNSITRELAASNGDKMVFVDLDSLVGGKTDSIFTDLAHVNDAGRELKARLIGEPLLEKVRTDSSWFHKRDATTDNYAIDGEAYYKSMMVLNEAWLGDLRQKSVQLGISLDSAMDRDAAYMHSQDALFTRYH